MQTRYFFKKTTPIILGNVFFQMSDDEKYQELTHEFNGQLRRYKRPIFRSINKFYNKRIYSLINKHVIIPIFVKVN